jgi:DNA-directed RNA polymerase specialized sigma24 family protein
MTSLMKVPFYGDTLEACGTSREDAQVSIRRVCEALGVASQSQLEKLKGKAWATVTMIVAVAEDGKQREHAMIALKSLPMWLATIDARKVSEHVREKLARYQKEAHDVLAAHFLKQEMPEKQEQFPGGPNALVPLLSAMTSALQQLAAGQQQNTATVQALAARVEQLEGGTAAAYRLTPSQRAMKAAQMEGVTQDEAAERMGVSVRSVGNAAVVLREAPALVPAVERGKIDVATAAKVARMATRAECVIAAADPKAEARRLLSVVG